VRAEEYRERAGRIIGAALTSDVAYKRLAWLTDRIGNRLSGSESLTRAIEWAVSEMKRDRLDNVRAEKVMVPHWVRGEESLELIEPVGRRLSMLGLGNSVGTPPEGVRAEAVVVRSFDELEALGERVRGKIVVYNVPFTTYGETVAYRGVGPSRAAKYGAVAVVVRSVTQPTDSAHGLASLLGRPAEDSRRGRHHRGRGAFTAHAGTRRAPRSSSQDGGTLSSRRRIGERRRRA
jgi:carboxypeptidase Q